MKIVKLVLENFEAVKYCLNTNYLELDLSKCENRICLLIGPNGSGKTTLLSLLNPFSTLGNLDVRDGYHLIIPHKDGKKEIWYQCGENLYTIQHYYTAAKDTHSTKSFIQLNGKELNPNGNVTSFKEVVKTHLGIELGYLKLTRLGPNVKSLIESSSTERKTFMGKLLDDIGVYLDYYKHVNTNLKTLKDMISHTIDQSKKLMYTDRKSYEKDIVETQKTIDRLDGNLRLQQDELAVVSSKVSDIGNIMELRTKLSDTEKAYRKMTKTKIRLGEDAKDAAYYREAYRIACEERSQKETLLATTNLLLDKELENRNHVEDHIHKLSVRLEKESAIDKEVQRLTTLLDETKKQIIEREKILHDFECEMDLGDFEKFLVYLKSSQQAINHCYEFGQEPLSEVVKLIQEKKDVEHYISSCILEESEVGEEDEAFLQVLKSIMNQGTSICEKRSCAGYKVVRHLETLLEERANRKHEKNLEYYQSMQLIYQGIYPVLEGFQPYAETIKQFPKKVRNEFKLVTILNRLDEGKPLYDVPKMDQFYTLLKEQDDLKKRYEVRDDVMKRIETYNSFSQSADLKEEYQQEILALDTSKSKIVEYRNEVADLSQEVQDLGYTAESMEDAMNVCEHYEETEKLLEELRETYERYQGLSTKEAELTRSVQILRMELRKKQEEIGRLKTGLTLYLDNKKNLKNYQKHYDNMSLTRQALSASKGIPTIIVKHYLRDTVDITNDLLDIAYHGNIMLGDFNIDADEFTMPVYNRGAQLPDVKLLSQGELALTSVAISFALVSQSLNGYNIMSLDEIDGALDTDNRRNFILIMERQIERIGSEQNFMITHNDAFSSYPVDIIDLSGEHNQEAYKYATFIPIIKTKKEDKQNESVKQ